MTPGPLSTISNSYFSSSSQKHYGSGNHFCLKFDRFCYIKEVLGKAMDAEQKPSLFKEKDPQDLILSAKKRLEESKNKEERFAVLRSIANLNTAWAYEVLLNALADPHEEIRRFLVARLAQKEDLDLNLLYKRLQTPPWYIKIEVLKILGLKKNQRSAKHIEAVLGESNDEVRRTAAQVLGEIGGDHARSLLVKLTRDSNPFVRKAAEKSLNATSELKFL